MSAVPRVSRAASTQALAARSAFTGNEESTVSPRAGSWARQVSRGPTTTPSGAGVCVWLWAQGPPAAELVSEQGREGAARKVFCRPGEENRPLFLEEKNSRFFLQKYLFLPESELGGRVFEEMYYFLLFPCTQKNNTRTETLPKAVLSRWTGFRKARILGGTTCSLVSQTYQ